MSFNGRLHNIALGGLLAGLLFASAVSAQENEPAQKAQAPQPQQTEQRPARPLSVTVTGPVSIEREKSVEPNWKKPSCDAPQNHDEADLCQQIRMSEAAESSVRLNGYQSGIALLGALLVIITIVYARRAAIAARDAAAIADKTLIATQNNILKQLRAYIWVDRAWITFDRARRASGARLHQELRTHPGQKCSLVDSYMG
jgi:hypothetical protein